MKFGKEFAAQMVPEWQEAYMNYSYLKSLIKNIQHFKQSNRPPPPPPATTTPSRHNIKRRHTLYRAFSGLTRSRHHQEPISPTTPEDVENQAILVHPVRSSEGSNSYQTTFLMAAEEGGVMELEYFKRADDEFNKVDKFYREKVEEVMKEAAVLNKQMDALIAFRIKVENPEHERLFDWSREMIRLASDVAASTAQLAASTPRRAGTSRRAYMATDVIEEDGSSSEGEHSGDDDKEKEEHVDRNVKVEKPEKLRGNKLAALEVLNRVTMNQTVETPRSTIKGFLNVPQQTDLKFSKGNLNKVEEQLKRAFVVFYHKLRLLKSFG